MIKSHFILSRGILIILLLFSFSGISNNKFVLKSLNKNQDCLSLLLYFDIDNTAQSYFNNIIYLLANCSELFPNEKNTANIVLPEFIFQDQDEINEFKSKIIIDSNKWSLNIVLSDSLFKSLPFPKGLAKYIFYQSDIPIAFGTCKWDNPNQFKNDLNCNGRNASINIKLIDKANIRKKVLTDNNIIEVVDSNKVLLLDDYNNKMILFDYNNKKLTVKEFPCNFFDPTELFCKHYAKNEEECEIAKIHIGGLKNIGKDKSYFTSISTSENRIYVCANFFAHKKQEKDHYFINDIGGFDTIRKGTIIGHQFSAILEFDNNLNFIKVIPILDNELYNTKGEIIVAGVDFGFYIENNQLYSYLTPFSTKFKDENLDYCIGKFTLNKDSCFVFHSFCEFPYPHEYSKRDLFNATIKVKKINGSLVYSFGSYDYFFVDSIKHTIDFKRVKSTLKNESINTNVAMDVVQYCNYFILGISKDVYSDNTMVFFRVDNQFCIEVFDSEYNSVGYTVLNKYEHFPNPEFLMELIGVSIEDNILTINYRDKGSIFLARYRLSIVH